MRWLLLLGIAGVLSLGCNSDNDASTSPNTNESPIEQIELTTLDNGEPSHVTVQHILIAFDGSLPDKQILRTQAESEKLANEVMEKAKGGDDFDDLVKRYTDDKPPGIYRMANIDQATDMRSADRSLWIRPRTEMVPAFGEVSFGLEVGGIGMTDYNPYSSPFGWHIIKRIK